MTIPSIEIETQEILRRSPAPPLSVQPVLVRLLGAGGRCRWVNGAWCNFTGRDRMDLLGERWFECVHPDDRETCTRECREAFLSNRVYRVEYRLRSERGADRWILEIGTPRRTALGHVNGYVATAIDITRHKRAEKCVSLQLSISRLLSKAARLDDIANPILQALTETFELEFAELRSFDPLSGESRRIHAWPVEPPHAGGAVAARDAMRSERLEPDTIHGAFCLPVEMRPDANAFLLVSAHHAMDQGDPAIEFFAAIGIELGAFIARRRSEQVIRNVERGKSAARDGVYQARLRSLMAELLLTEEHERRRLAIDLHDGLSQTIALARMKLAALRQSMDGKLCGKLDEIDALIDQTNRDARAVSFELSPPVLHDLGLEPAVQWLVENIETRYGIKTALDDDGEPKPADPDTRVILFRSIRELLINAAKHAKARRVWVRLRRANDQLSATVEDDGVGMDPEAASTWGSGLISIHERLNHVGGSMAIESVPGHGTRVRLCAPIAGAGSSGRPS